MGIFDKIKNKANEVHTCCCCGTEFSGLFKGRKLNDGQYACSKCKPELTNLMCQKGVCGDFNIYSLDSEGCRKYNDYRQQEKVRAAEFKRSADYLGEKFLVDTERGYFKLKEYPEIFLTSEIKRIIVKMVYDGGNIDVYCIIDLDNWIYNDLLVEFKYYCSSLFKKGKAKECIEYLSEFRNKVCPSAELIADA